MEGDGRIMEYDGWEVEDDVRLWKMMVGLWKTTTGLGKVMVGLW